MKKISSCLLQVLINWNGTHPEAAKQIAFGKAKVLLLLAGKVQAAMTWTM